MRSHKQWVKAPPAVALAAERAGIRVALTGPEGSVYSDVLDLRSRAFGIPTEIAASEEDDYSEIYCAYLGDLPAATVRMTRFSQGPYEAASYYPAYFVEELRPVAGSANRFCTSPVLPTSLGFGLHLCRIAWCDQVARGTRVDVINATAKVASYYRRLGYVPVRDSFFVHPRWGTKSFVLVMPVDDSRRHSLTDAFRDVAQQLRLDEIRERVPICDCESIGRCSCLTVPFVEAGVL